MEILDDKLYISGRDLVGLAGKKCIGSHEFDRCSNENYSNCEAYILFDLIAPNFDSNYSNLELCPVLTYGRPRIDAKFEVLLDRHTDSE